MACKKLIILLVFLITTIAYGATKQVRCWSIGQNKQCAYQIKQHKGPHKVINQTLYTQSNMPYALCMGVSCELISKKIATCVCPIFGQDDGQQLWHYISVGSKTYRNSQPTFQNQKLKTVVANISFANTSSIAAPYTVAYERCDFEQPEQWANCTGVRCQVSEITIKQKKQWVATCQCPIVKSKSFVSMGPKNISQCRTEPAVVWSGATQSDMNHYVAILKVVYGYAQAPR